MHTSNTSKRGNIPDLSVNLSQRRWVMLSIMSLNLMNNAIIGSSMTSNSRAVGKLYRMTSSEMTILNGIFQAMNTFTLISVIILNIYGLRVTVSVGALLDLIAAVFRLMGYTEDGYTLVLIGNVFGGLAHSFLIIAPLSLSAIWFGKKERVSATSISFFMYILGSSIGPLMAALFFKTSDSNLVLKKNLFIMFMIEAILSFIIFLATIAFFRAIPPSPPSYSQAMCRKRCSSEKNVSTEDLDFTLSDGIFADEYEKHELRNVYERMQSYGIINDWSSLLRKGYLYYLVLAYGIYLALFLALPKLFHQMIARHYPDKKELVRLLQIALPGLGLLQMALPIAWVDKTNDYETITTFCFTGSAIMMVIFTLVLRFSDNFVLLIVCICSWEVFSMPYISIGLEHSCDILYPLKESVISLVFLSFGQVSSTVVTHSGKLIITHLGPSVESSILAGLYLVGLVFVHLVKKEHRRSGIDRLHKLRYCFNEVTTVL